MASRTVEIKSYVSPDVKAKATEIYSHWGMSLSDAVNTFLIKSIDVGGLPFDMRPNESPRYDATRVMRADPRYGATILPADMNDEEDGLYDHLKE